MLNFEAVGVGEHRAGWPVVNAALRARAEGTTQDDSMVQLDDFVEQTFTYPGRGREILLNLDAPWVGIFHHPVELRGPLKSDVKSTVEAIMAHGRLHAALRRGALVRSIALCPLVAETVAGYTRTPCLAVRHPAGLLAERGHVPYWSEQAYEEGHFEEGRRSVLQLGFFMRHVRAVHQIDLSPDRYTRSRIRAWRPWQRFRDNELKRVCASKEVRPQDVREVERLHDDDYDEALSASVVVSHAFASAANNVTIECLARCTPIVLPRSRSAEWYLGREYPLFYDAGDDGCDLSAVASMIEDHERVVAAHEYMVELPGGRRWLSVDYFCDRVQEFLS